MTTRTVGHNADRSLWSEALVFPSRLAVVGVATVTAWWYGGVHAEVERWLFPAVLLALGCAAAQLFCRRSASIILPLATIPLIVALGLGALQLVPLPDWASAVLSPHAAELRGSLLPDPAASDASLADDLGVEARSTRSPVSLYPASTRQDLSLLLLGVAVFVVGSLAFCSPRAQLWLCGLIAINGAAFAFFGLVQQLTWNGRLYWTGLSPGRGVPFSAFVCRNNAGGFLNLCLAGAVGLTVWAVGSRGPSALGLDRRRFAAGSRRRFVSVSQRVTECVANLNAVTLAAVSLSACIAGGILCTLSRGAGVAMIGAAALTAFVVLCTRRRSLPLWFTAVALGGLALVAWVGMSDRLHARLATLLDQEAVSTEGRVPHWRDAVQAVPDFWRTGSGLGTYRFIYLLYQRRPESAWFYHAENQYLEALVEGGFLSLGLILGTIALMGIACWRLMRDAPDTRTYAMGVAGVFAVATQAIHAFFDFGLYLSANMTLFALLCGSVAGRAAYLTRPGWSPKLLALTAGRTPGVLLLATLFAGCLWGFREISLVAEADQTLDEVRFAQTVDGASTPELTAAIERLNRLIARRQDDPQAHHRMAKLWVHLYRMRKLEELRRAASPDIGISALWDRTSIATVRSRIHQLALNHQLDELEALRSEPAVRDHLKEALKHLLLARRSCPILPEIHMAIGTLSAAVQRPADDWVHLERARQLAAADPGLQYDAGLMEYEAGRPELAWKSWRRCLTLSSSYLADILPKALQRLDMQGLVERVLPESPEFLIELAQRQYAGEQHAEPRRILAERALGLLEQSDLPEDQRCHLRGSIFALQRQYAQAIESYRRAVELNSREVTWRYELALLLHQQGRLDEAREQARWCARMDPDAPQYRRLLEQIHQGGHEL